MIDCHSHCLPQMDDGARTVRESLLMLEEARAQGVDTVVATPHFYPGQETIAEFLARREAAATELRSHLKPDTVRLLLGAEVLIRQGLSQEDLRPLCIEGTDIILVEMPFYRPPDWLFEELENIALEQDLTLMLAHLDRYRSFFSREKLNELMELPNVIVQLNGEAFLDRHNYRKLRHWLPTPNYLVLGSDMHRNDVRRPNLKPAARALRRTRVGRRWLEMAQQDAPMFLQV